MTETTKNWQMSSFLPTSVQADENEFQQGIPFQGLLSSIIRGIQNCQRRGKKTIKKFQGEIYP